MFTGLIESKGKVLAIEKNREIVKLTIEPEKKMIMDQKHGASIAINGACLTVMEQSDSSYSYEVSSETLEKTSLGSLKKGSIVNMERALALGERLGGHLVSGHVDGLGKIVLIEKNADGWLVKIELSADLRKFVIPKGSICIDGISLTVNEVEDFDDHSLISLMIIPVTLEETTLESSEQGQLVNIEIDMLAKFAFRQNQFSS